MPPFETGGARRAAQAAALSDVLQLLRVGAPAMGGIAIGSPPHEPKQDADDSHDDEQRPPSKRAGDPEEKRAQKGQPEVLADRVHAGCARPLGLRKPHAQDPAVARVRRRLRDTQRKSRADQRPEAASKPLQYGAKGPQGHRPVVGESHTEPVEQDAAGNLRGGVSPRERGERDAHECGVQAQLPGQQRSGDADHCAIEVVDHRAGGDQPQDEEPGARGLHSAHHVDRLCRHESPWSGGAGGTEYMLASV